MDTDPQADESADVVVIGAGPAGSATALRLARRGLHVLQIERRRFLDPRNDRLRSGEGLIPRARRELAALGLSADAAPWALSRIRQVRISWFDQPGALDDIAGSGGIVQVDRELLDYSLFCAARRAGVDGREGWRARQLQRDPRGRVVGVIAQPPGDQPPRLLRAPLVVDAGGRDALAIRELALRPPGADCDFFAISMFFDQVADLDQGVWEMHLLDPERLGVVMLSQLDGGLVRCALGTAYQHKRCAQRRPQAFFWDWVRRSPRLARRLADSREVCRSFARACIGYQVSQVTFDGLLLVGDAAGYLNPLFGDGILRALVMARHAAAAIEAALRRGDCSRAGLAGYARRRAAIDRLSLLARGALLRAYRHPRALARLSQIAPLRHALLAALLRP